MAFSQSIEELNAQADSFNAEGLNEEVIDLCSEVLERNNADTHSLRLRGASYIELDEYLNAHRDFSKILELDSGCYRCYIALASIEGEWTNYERAKHLVNRAMLLKPHAARPYALRGNLNEHAGYLADALVDYNKAIELGPANVDFYLERAKFSARNGSSALARKDINKAVALAPDNVNALYLRGLWNLDAERWNSALRDFDRCLQLDSLHANAWFRKGSLLLGLKGYVEAEEALSRAIQLDSLYYLSYYNRGIGREKLLDLDGACRDYHTALTLISGTQDLMGDEGMKESILRGYIKQFCDKDMPTYYQERGLDAFAKADYELAVRFYNEGVQRFPSHLKCHFFLGDALKAQGSDSAALKSYIVALGLAPELNQQLEQEGTMDSQDSVYIKYLNDVTLGSLYASLSGGYLNTNDTALAMTLADSAIGMLSTIHPVGALSQMVLSKAYIARGMINCQLGQFDVARQDLSQAMFCSPKEAVSHLALAMVLLQESQAMRWERVSLMSRGVFTVHDGLSFITPDQSEINTGDLERVITESTVALQRDSRLLIAYLIRAHAKRLLGRKDYCEDVLAAKEHGVSDVQERLGIQCE